MAGRNIASMHLFLEMKKRFPDIQEDVLRNYVFLYAEDETKCISLLQKESKNHFYTSQPFADFNLFKRKVNGNSIDDAKHTYKIVPDIHNVAPLPLLSTESNNIHIDSLSYEPKKEIQSAPVTPSTEKPIVDAYKTIPMSSHTKSIGHVSDQRMIFSTTKKHTIQPMEVPEKVGAKDSAKKHAVSLSITPSFPFAAQQQMNVYTSAVTAATSHASKPGRHTTSLNLQLQPDSRAVDISAVPTNSGVPCHYADFGSHLHISVGSQGATFTALRLQRPSSQLQKNSNNSPGRVELKSCSKQSECSMNKTSKEQKHPKNKMACDMQNAASDQTVNSWYQKCSPKMNFDQIYQPSSDYIQAVKRHQLSQLSLISEELNDKKSVCSELKNAIHKLEQQMALREETSSSYTSPQVLKTITDENQKLRRECDNLLMEIDLRSKGQVPLGVTDEDFYANIFTGPDDGLVFLSDNGRDARGREEGEWRCSECTFANHPALQRCEMCELPKKSGPHSNYSTSSHLTLAHQHTRPVGSVQISVTRRSPKSVQLQLTHRRT